EPSWKYGSEALLRDQLGQGFVACIVRAIAHRRGRLRPLAQFEIDASAVGVSLYCLFEFLLCQSGGDLLAQPKCIKASRIRLLGNFVVSDSFGLEAVDRAKR